MKVPDIHGVVQGLDPARHGQSAQTPSPSSPREARSPDGDCLDISLSTRILGVSKEVAETVTAMEPELPAAREEEIRERVRTGFYNTDELLEDTGQRVLGFYAH